MKEYDFFVSHATEDKDEIVRPLVLALENIGFNVWYDEFALTIGDSLVQKINDGLKNSEYGLVVLSKNFFRKNWTTIELDTLFSRQIQGSKVILPIWHNITKEEIMEFHPMLAGIKAVSTEGGINSVVVEILKVKIPKIPKRNLNYIKESKQLLSSGNYEAAVFIASKRLEIFLRDLAYQKIGKENVKWNGSIQKLLQILIDNNYIKTKGTNYRYNLDMLWKIRNEAVHDPSSITFSKAKTYINIVEELIIKNQIL
jgi:hypothetical protein